MGGKLLGFIIVQRDRTLLLNSKITYDYKVLVDFLENSPNLKEEDKPTLSEEAQVFFRDMLDKIITKASEEWKCDTDKPLIILEGKNRTKCELCGQPIKKICHITNQLNDTTLKVGIECVKKFDLDRDFNMNEWLKDAQRAKRLNELNQAIEGIEGVVFSWGLFLEQQEIYIPYSKKRTYLDCKRNLQEFFDYFCNNDIKSSEKEKIVSKIKELIILGEKEKSSIAQYVDKNISNVFIPSKRVVKNISDSTVIKMLSEDEKITARTLFRIIDSELAKKFIPLFNKEINKDSSIVIDDIGTKNNKLGYVCIYKKQAHIKLFCLYEIFCRRYGGLATNEKNKVEGNISIDEIIKISSIYDESSVDYALSILERQVLRKKGYFIDQVYHEFKDIILKEKESNEYIIIPLEFIEKFKDILFIKSFNKDEELNEYIMAKGKHYSRDDIKYLKEEREKQVQFI